MTIQDTIAMDRTAFTDFVAGLLERKRSGAPLEETFQGFTVRINESHGMYGITAYGPRGAYDRMRDIHPERVRTVAGKIWDSLTA